MGVYMDAANTLIAFWINETNKLQNWYEKKLLSTDDATVDWGLYKDADEAFHNLTDVHDRLVGIGKDLADSYTALANTWSGPGADIYKSVIGPLQDYIDMLVDRAQVYAKAASDTGNAHLAAINTYTDARNAAIADVNTVWNDPAYRDALINNARTLEKSVTQASVDSYFSKYDEVDKKYTDDYTKHRTVYGEALNELQGKYTTYYATLKAIGQKPTWGFDDSNGFTGPNDKDLKDSDGDKVPDVYDGSPNDPTTANPPLDDKKADLPDSDGDGVADVFDGSPNDPTTANPPLDDKKPDLPDSDGDNVPDVYDGSPDDPTTANPPPPPEPETPDTSGLDNGSTLDSQPPPATGDLVAPPEPGELPPPPSPSNLVPGPNGEPGFDLTGNGVPDVGLGGNILPGSNLPPGSKVVRSPNGATGVDLDGDDIPDVDLAGHALPGGNAPPGSTLVTTPDGRTGLDLDGNGVPDVDVHGAPLSPTVPAPGGGNLGGGNLGEGGNASGQVPGSQVIPGPGAAPTPFPGRPVAGGTPVAGTVAAQVGTMSAAGIAASAGRYPPMMPPMMPPHVGENKERETWLQEEEGVWADDDLMVMSALGRPSRDEDDEASEAMWETPPEPARPLRSRPRPQQPGGGYPEQAARRF